MSIISSVSAHLEIHARLQQRPQRVHVAVLDVPAIFAQVQRDVVGAGLLGEPARRAPGRDTRARRACRTRGDVVDVDARARCCTGLMKRSSPRHRTRDRARPQLAAFQTMIERLPQHAARDVERLRVVERLLAQREQAAPGSTRRARPRAPRRAPATGEYMVVRAGWSTSSSSPYPMLSSSRFSNTRKRGFGRRVAAPGGAASRRNRRRAAAADRGAWSA